MELTCYIIDDEVHAIELLADYVDRTSGLALMGSAIDPMKGLKQLLTTDAPDILFLDIQMPGLSGLQLAGLVGGTTTVVLTTAFSQFALDAFENKVFDYLLKPLSYPRFYQCVQRLQNDSRRDQSPVQIVQEFFFVKSEIKGRLVRIVLSDILFVEASQNYVRIHLQEGLVMPYLTINEMEQFLPSHRFSRIHQSFIVNHDHLRIVETGRVILQNNTELNIGRLYQKVFLEKMGRYLVRSKRKR